MRLAGLIFLLIFWMLVLAAILIVPKFGVIAAIIGILVFIYKKVRHIRF